MHTGFHVEDGLFFDRLENGSVRIYKLNANAAHRRANTPHDDLPEITIATLDEDSWNSVVDSMIDAFKEVEEVEEVEDVIVPSMSIPVKSSEEKKEDASGPKK